jgi:primase-polymerase (primpol)-like protein
MRANNSQSENCDHPLTLPAVLQPLIERPSWIVWKWEEPEEPGGKRRKVPYQARRLQRKAKSDNSKTWTTYEVAVAAVAAGKADGIGFALTNTAYVAFDIDKCRNKDTGEIEPWGQILIEEAKSYTEVSVSGTGVHVIGTGKGAEIDRKFSRSSGGSVEIYRKATRFLYMSGEQIGSTGLADMDAIIDRVFAELEEKSKTSSGSATDTDVIPVNELIQPDDPRLAKLNPKYIALGFHGEGIDPVHRSRWPLSASACGRRLRRMSLPPC